MLRLFVSKLILTAAHLCKYSFHAATVFSIFIAVLKAAILLDWIRIFVPHGSRNFMFYACYFFLFATVAFYVSMVITNLVACVPYEYNWNKLIDGRCDRIQTGKTNLGASVFNFLMDILMFFLPQRVIWRLQISTRKKLGVSLVFMIGLVAIISTAIRLAITIINVNSEDYTYTFSQVMLCCLGESVCGILILCGPTFPRVASSMKQSQFFSSIIRSWMTMTTKITQGTKEARDSVQNFSPRDDYSRIEENRPIPLKQIDGLTTTNSDLDYHHFAVVSHSSRPQKYEPRANI